MIITLLGRDIEFVEKPHHEVKVLVGIFEARIRQHDASKTDVLYDWVLETRTRGVKVMYGEGYSKDLAGAVKRVNELASEISREMFYLAFPEGFIPPTAKEKP